MLVIVRSPVLVGSELPDVEPRMAVALGFQPRAASLGWAERLDMGVP